MEAVLEKIHQFADTAHDAQLRRYTPDRYIVHPARVMETCRNYDNRLPTLAAALLHDVLEDTAVTENEMLNFLYGIMDKENADKTLALVIEMTDVFTWEAYRNWNRKKRKAEELKRIEQTSPEAQTIKYADIIDNSSEIALNDPDFATRYLLECKAILKVADKGNPELREIAIRTVRENLKMLGETRGLSTRN